MPTTPVTNPLEELKAKIAALEAENAQLLAAHQRKPATLTMKAGEKGGISVYGIGRFPVTLPFQTWRRIATSILGAEVKSFAQSELAAFAMVNAGQLTAKNAKGEIVPLTEVEKF